MAGCQKTTLPSNAVILQVASYSSSVEQTFSFPADAQYFKENGADDETINEYIEALTTSIKMKVWNKIFLNYFLIYSQNPSNEFALDGDQVVLNQAQYNSVTDSISFSFVFKSVAAWNYYHQSNNESEEENEQDGGIQFLDVTFSDGVFPFCQSSGSQPIGYDYAKLIQDEKEKFFSQELLANEPAISFVYDYATTHKRVHSNADVVYSNSLYHHVWTSSYDQLTEEKTIQLYTVNAIRGWWYLIALIVAIVCAGVGTIIILCLKNQKNKKANNKKIKESF